MRVTKTGHQYNSVIKCEQLWNIHTLQSELSLLHPFAKPFFAHIVFQKV